MRRILFYGRIMWWLECVPRLRPIRFWTYVYVRLDAKQHDAYLAAYPPKT